jgi:hypothetical protein
MNKPRSQDPSDRMRLSEDAQLSEDARQQALEELLNPDNPRANVQGFGHGVKWTNGEPTGTPALLVFVTQKLPQESLSEGDMIPAQLSDNTPTDVVTVGLVTAQAATTSLPTPSPGLVLAGEQAPSRLTYDFVGHVNGDRAAETVVMPETQAVGAQLLTRRMRPCPSGFSIGSVLITAGTLGSVAYDFLPGASVNPPAPGIGIPPKFYVLSNNHVLAASNAAPIGTSIVQPGRFDGGVDPQDRIATLSRFVPIQLEPPIPRVLHRNLVDCAIGECQFQDATREIYFNGAPRGWRRRANVRVGDRVKKTGRTTNMTFGRIISTTATIDVSYGGAGVARFNNQIVTTNISAGGDSGSLVLSLDNVAVGLLFAGSSVVTIVNHFEFVRALLRVEIAEQIL